MLRVTAAQLGLLEQNLRSGAQAPARAQREPRRKEDLPENVLEAQIRDFLAWRGYVNVRQHVGTFVPYRVVKQLQCGRFATDQVSRHVGAGGRRGCRRLAVVASGDRIWPPPSRRALALAGILLGSESSRKTAQPRAARVDD
jgi:hypothetical protein